jgi:hypothetical protein
MHILPCTTMLPNCALPHLPSAMASAVQCSIPGSSFDTPSSAAITYTAAGTCHTLSITFIVEPSTEDC